MCVFFFTNILSNSVHGNKFTKKLAAIHRRKSQVQFLNSRINYFTNFFDSMKNEKIKKLILLYNLTKTDRTF